MILNKIGKNVNIERGAYFTRLLSVGNNSGLGINCYLTGEITIGDNVLMGPNVQVFTINHNYSNPNILIGLQGNCPSKPVIIEDDCWIAANAIILPGVTISRGSVVAAGSVVTKSFPPYSVIGGNPAQLIKNRKDIHSSI